MPSCAPWWSSRTALHLLYEVPAQPPPPSARGGLLSRRPHGGGGDPGAVRPPGETEEELAIPRREIEILGKPDFICNQAGFLMQPVLGLVSAAGFAAMAPSSAEVGTTFTAPLSFFRQTPPEQYAYAPAAGGAGGLPL